MSMNHTIERADGVTTIRLRRKLGLEEVLDVIDQVAREDDGNRRLWDLTEHFDFSSQEIEQIAARGRVLWPKASRVAYVAADALAFGLLRMLEVYREQKNYETKVFRAEDEALRWLKAWVE